MADKEVKVRITANTKGVTRALRGVKRQLERLRSLSRAIGRGIGRAFKFAAVGMGAAAAASVLLVRKFMAQEDAEQALTAATGRAIDAHKEFAAEIQRTTKFGDEQVLMQMAYARNLGVTEEKLQDATKAAVGLAAKYRIDLQTAMMLVGRASQGQTQMLTRYGIVLDDSLSTQDKFNALLKIGAGAFGLAEAEANTLRGRLAQMRNRVGDLAEKFGEAIANALNLKDRFQGITSAVDRFIARIDKDNSLEEWADRAATAIDKLQTVLGGLFDKQKRAESLKTIAAGISLAFKLGAATAVDFLVNHAPAIGKAIGDAFIASSPKLQAIENVRRRSVANGDLPDNTSSNQAASAFAAGVKSDMAAFLSGLPTGGGGGGGGLQLPKPGGAPAVTTGAKVPDAKSAGQLSIGDLFDRDRPRALKIAEEQLAWQKKQTMILERYLEEMA